METIMRKNLKFLPDSLPRISEHSPAYVYVMEISLANRDWNQSLLYKIGRTTNLKNRLKTISHIWGENTNYLEYVLLRSAFEIEKALHDKYYPFLCEEPLGIKHSGMMEYYTFNCKILDSVLADLQGDIKW